MTVFHPLVFLVKYSSMSHFNCPKVFVHLTGACFPSSSISEERNTLDISLLLASYQSLFPISLSNCFVWAYSLGNLIPNLCEFTFSRYLTASMILSFFFKVEGTYQQRVGWVSMFLFLCTQHIQQDLIFENISGEPLFSSIFQYT